MPEREYFSLRYAVPGYSFLLVVIALNILPLMQVLKGTQADFFGAFLGFLSLFAGSAIGFIVSQFFYFKLDRNKMPYRIQELTKLTEVLIESTNPPSDSEKLKASKDDVEAVTDFLFNMSAGENEAFVRYSERRWDMYLLMSSLLWSLGVGALFGITVRAYFEIALFKNSIAIDRLNLTELVKWVQSINNTEVLTWIFALVAILLLIGVLRGQRHRIMVAYYPLFEGFLRYVAQNENYKKALKQAFPKYFEPKGNKEKESAKAPSAGRG